MNGEIGNWNESPWDRSSKRVISHLRLSGPSVIENISSDILGSIIHFTSLDNRSDSVLVRLRRQYDFCFPVPVNKHYKSNRRTIGL